MFGSGNMVSTVYHNTWYMDSVFFFEWRDNIPKQEIKCDLVTIHRWQNRCIFIGKIPCIENDTIQYKLVGPYILEHLSGLYDSIV